MMKALFPNDPMHRVILMLILAGFVGLGLIYSVATPILETPDEVTHYPLVEHLSNHPFDLPEQDPDHPGPWQQEGSQPPLYYWLSAILAAPIDHSDLEERLEPNPHNKIGVGLATDNNVTQLHDWDAEAFPWKKTVLGVHLVRLFSLLLGLGTVLCAYWVARLSVPELPTAHLLAAALVAFNPMFLFISAAVNNDNLINLLSTAVLALLLLIWRRGLTQRRVIGLALLLALATLSKLSGLTLYPLAGLVLLMVVWRDRIPRRDWIRYGLIIAAAWIVLAGWWYLRNIRLYGEFTGTQRMIEIIGGRDGVPTWGEAVDELKGFHYSFWGLFGTFNVMAPDWLFTYADALTLVGLAGLVIYVIRLLRRERGRSDVLPLLFLAIQIGIVSAALLNWTIQTLASQGRLAFPALASLATLVAAGLVNLPLSPLHGERRRAFSLRAIQALPIAPALVAPLIAAAAVLPFSTIAPAYRVPPTMRDLPKSAIPIDARFGPIELVGIKVESGAVRPGDTMDITLYWRPTAHTEENLSFYAQIYGLPDPDSEEGLQEIGKIDSYPGRGLLQTTTWDINRIYADMYHIEISDDAQTPVRPKIKIGWWNYATKEDVLPVSQSGDPLDAVVIDAGRISGEDIHLEGGQEPGAVFAGVLRLNRFLVEPGAPGDVVTVRLEWEALSRVCEDFTILVHLLDPDQPDRPITTGDAPPLDGRWPTSAWVPHHTFVDAYLLTLPPDLPPGTYPIAVGFYRPADYSRLPVETENATLPGAVILPQTVAVP